MYIEREREREREREIYDIYSYEEGHDVVSSLFLVTVERVLARLARAEQELGCSRDWTDAKRHGSTTARRVPSDWDTVDDSKWRLLGPLLLFLLLSSLVISRNRYPNSALVFFCPEICRYENAWLG